MTPMHQDRCRTRHKGFVAGVVALVLALVLLPCRADEPAVAPAAEVGAGATNAPEVLRSYLQLQQQLQAAQQAIEQNRQEARTAASQTAEMLAQGLQRMQESLAAQRARDLAALQRDNRVALLVASTLALFGFLAMGVLIWAQWRMSRHLAGITAVLPAAFGLEAGASADLPRLPQPGLPLRSPEAALAGMAGPRPRLSIERRLFPRSNDAFRRKQFRALKMAVVVGLVFGGLVALVLYLVYAQSKA
jgi:hypothetical protein